MNILLLGSGGREHALAWKLAQSPLCAKLWASPGNPGMAQDAICIALDASKHDEIVHFCTQNAVDLVVIGPEAPLVGGLGDSLRAAGIAVFGPDKAAAQLEGSKGFTKDLCAEAGIPTAGYIRTSRLAEAEEALAKFSAPYVLKADGLAAGKGVVIADNAADAKAALAEMFGGKYGDAGAEVVIEEFLEGEEASFFALSDGKTVIPIGTAQDHKRVGEGDTGPNTGGMGAYSPAPVLTAELQEQTMRTIVEPTVKAMAARGTPYSGVLYAGLMLTERGPELIEYNARFGDPECQVLMMRLESDLAEVLMACAKGELAEAEPPRFKAGTAMTVVMAARGYPEAPKKGGLIVLPDAQGDRGPNGESGVKVFHAGTKEEGGQLIANGGRVLNVTATGASAAEAQRSAYAALEKIDFADGFCRRDIGYREVARERER